MSELKPCPFCGGKAIVRDATYGANISATVVYCGNKECVIKPSTAYRRVRKKAIEEWNRRASE